MSDNPFASEEDEPVVVTPPGRARLSSRPSIAETPSPRVEELDAALDKVLADLANTEARVEALLQRLG